jgi:transcriptional regulator of acetoin/glycerol metabolism
MRRAPRRAGPSGCYLQHSPWAPPRLGLSSGQVESEVLRAIVRSLLNSGGSKGKAAGSLGMSRATIYRKIHEYGIVAPSG